MNLKPCTFERLAFISLGFGRGAQVGKTSLLEVEFITAQASMLGVFNTKNSQFITEMRVILKSS